MADDDDIGNRLKTSSSFAVNQSADEEGDLEDTEGHVKSLADHCVEAEKISELCAELGAPPSSAKQQPSSSSSHQTHEFSYFHTQCGKAAGFIEKYQEQPHLLDPHLEKWIKTLLQNCFSNEISSDQQASIFSLMYTISKVRGHKNILKHFPHEATDYHAVLEAFLAQNPSDHQAWMTRYVLILWLSMLAMIPFDMAVLNSAKDFSSSLLALCKEYLSKTDKCRDAAALLIARFITRPDMKGSELPVYVRWATELLPSLDANNHKDMFLLTGVLSSLAAIFKIGKRDHLLPFAPPLLEVLSSATFRGASNSLVRKLATKLIQRCAMALLKPKIAKWRYQRGTRSLMHNLAKASSIPAPLPSSVPERNPTSQADEDDDEEDYDIPEELEQVIECLLHGLRDRDTVVRWSAAKGIGRVCGRLPSELADDVTTSILEMFTLHEHDSAWHGGCLALAEMGRRGLILPPRLPKVFNVVLKSLEYDVMRGACSVGAHVRDAACYLSWAFGRAYDPVVVASHVEELARGLVLVALFDREINVRRAASAAFQEHVGRQGSFPHGIDIITAADYFALGNRTNAYLEISVYVGGFPEYYEGIVRHLCDVKVSHWDREIRELTGQALHALTQRAPSLMAACLRSTLLPGVFSVDLNTRHGCTYAVGQVVNAILAVDKTGDIDAPLRVEVGQMVIKMAASGLFRGIGGELVRSAAFHTMKMLAMANFDLPNREQTLASWQELIDDNLAYVEARVQNDAIEAFRSVAQYYYSANPELHKPIVERLIKELASSSSTPARRGYALAVGSLPPALISDNFEAVVACLILGAQYGDQGKEKKAEARSCAVSALTMLLGCLSPPENPLALHELATHHFVEKVLHCYLVGIQDYTVDSRGDIGSKVREASILGLEQLCYRLARIDAALGAAPNGHHQALLTPARCEAIMAHIAQLTLEKIDRTRAIAGCALVRLVVSTSPAVPHIPYHEDLRLILGSRPDLIDWASPSAAFPLTVQFLSLPPYRHLCLTGLVVSVGGLTQSLVAEASTELNKYLNSIDGNELVSFVGELIEIFSKNQKLDRVTIPLFKTIELLFSSEPFESFLASSQGSEFGMKLIALMKIEVAKCTNVKKLIPSIDVFCGLVQFGGEVRKSSLARLSIFLCHTYPLIRTRTAELLYTTLMTDENIDSEHLDEILSILENTIWDGNASTVKEPRDRLCSLLSIPKPVPLASSSAPSTSNAQKDELASYKDLVDRNR